MTDNRISGTNDDFIDRLLDLRPGGAVHSVRHGREKVLAATQGSYDALFDPRLTDLSVGERLLVAVYACRLAGSPALASHYRERLADSPVNPALLEAVEHDTVDGVQDKRARAMLRFTRILTLEPVEGDQAVLQALPAAGLGTPAIVALAQLIAFLSYQVRLVAGLKAMSELKVAK